jgi:endonuclease-8
VPGDSAVARSGKIGGVPEGDTVYLTARRLDAGLAGHQLVRGELRHPRLIEHDLAERTVLGVRSVGKILATAQRVAVGFRLHDMALLPTIDEHRLVDHLGPDLLDPQWTDAHKAEALRRLTASADTEIGLALLDQRIMAGVGNLYRCEVCYLLGVSPRTPVSAVADPQRAVTLARTLLRRNAERPEQSTTREFGRGRQHWVYERAGQPCRRCGTTIRRVPQGDGVYARHVYYCPSCQPEPSSKS